MQGCKIFGQLTPLELFLKTAADNDVR